MNFDLFHLSRSLRQTFEVRASEWALALMLFNWSIILSVSPDLFAVNASYRAIAQVMPQETWTLVCFFAGAGRLACLFVNGSWRRTPHLRAIGAFISCFFWFQITLGFAQIGTWNTGLAVYPVLLALDAYNTFRAITDAAIVDKHFKRVTADVRVEQ